MTKNTTPAAYVSPGMPPLERQGKTLSSYEFWPMWLMYLPVVVQTVVLAIYYRSLTLPLIANPKLPLSGLVGMAKSTLFQQAEGKCQEAILDWFVHQTSDAAIDLQIHDICQNMGRKSLAFPIVCKPDIGCRGSGVKLVKQPSEFEAIIASYPVGTPLLLQRLADYEPEAGVFFVKHPGHKQGDIVSLALKYTPYVVGDGSSTLKQLLENDDRAGDLLHLYTERHADILDTVIADQTPFRLVFSASHCRGAIFRDGRHYVTAELTEKLNELMAGLPEFYYGRLDVKFKDIASLQAGETLQIVEINGASAESLHIWDSNMSLKEAFSALLYQYRTLFAIGSYNRRMGYKTPGLKALIKGINVEKQLQKHYPITD